MEMVQTEINQDKSPSVRLRGKLREVPTTQEEGKRYQNGHPKKSSHAPEVWEMMLSLSEQEKQITAVLIAEKKGFDLSRTEDILNYFTKAKFVTRTPRMERDKSTGQIRTWYEYKITELGQAWDYKKIPFYMKNYPITVALLKEKMREKRKLMLHYFQENKKTKNLTKTEGGKNSPDRRIEPEYACQYYYLKGNNIAKAVAELSKEKLETAERISAVFQVFLFKQIYHSKNHIFTPLEKPKLILGGSMLHEYFEKNKRNFAPGMIHSLREFVEVSCQAMLDRFDPKDIRPGHFCSKYFYDVVLPGYLFRHAFFYKDYDSLADVPGAVSPDYKEACLKLQEWKRARREEGDYEIYDGD